MILQHREKGYFLILKENIQVPEYLKEILAIEDVIIKHFELIKQFQLHNQIISSKNDEFIIQWVIIDTNKKYWTTLRNGVFEYGSGIIEDPLITISTPESTALDYFYQESTALRKLDIQGKRNVITAFEKIRERVFFTGNHPLGNDTNERLLIIGYQTKEKEGEEEQKRKQLLKLKKIEKEKRRKQEIIEEREKEKKHEEKERFYYRLVSNFENLTGIYDEIKITDLEKKLPKEIQENYSEILNKNFVALIEEMIMNNDIRARIRGEYLTFIRGEVNSKPNLKKERIASQDMKYIAILRGGDWKIEDNQSVFYFKIKVKNSSKFVITNIQILLTSVPPGLLPELDRYKIETLNPDSFESPQFKFTAKDSCVGDFIKGMVIFTDQKGNQQTITIKPFRIEYVCNLLVPKSITKENYRKNTASMQERKIIFECDLESDKLESEVAQILNKNNFFILDVPNKRDKPDFRKIKAYAEGKYDKQDVALSVIIQKLADQKNKLIIKAMSDKDEKIIDLLRDISIKCDALKSTPEYSEDLASIEVNCTNCESIIIVTDNMKLKDFIICEVCGEEIEILK